MTRKTVLTLLLVLFAVFATFAQMGPGGGKGKGGRNYDKASEITVKGIVEDVTHPTGQKGRSRDAPDATVRPRHL